MELKRRKIRGEVRNAWTCEITWFLDQAAGLDEKLHYIIFDDEDPSTYYIRVPGGTVGSIWLDDNYNIRQIYIDAKYVVGNYPVDINEQMRKFVGERMMAEVMYCDGDCQYLDTNKGKCKLDNKRKMAKIKYSNSWLSTVVYEHIGFCEMDGKNEEVNE